MIYTYDTKFNQNEYFILFLLTFYIGVFLLPRRFALITMIMFVMFGIASGRFWDQLIGTPSIDFYDINDSSDIEVFDILLYCSYGSFSYLMIYFFDKLKLKKRHVKFYILFWGIIALGFEFVGTKLGVFHYRNGYHLIFSLPVYLITYSVLFLLYFKFGKRHV